ncbi:MAG TPA: DNA gyrase inhibitor YacG [Planctomycetota bacterium]|nr:DNA gyrase inhibitor YacG [Planctomycetota bacterium]
MPEAVPCPTCGTDVPTPADWRPDSFPFCCARCRVLDLGAWASDRYVIAGRAPAFADDSSEDDATR